MALDRFLDLFIRSSLRSALTIGDNYNLKSHKYVCITTYKPYTKSNPNPNSTAKQHTIVNIERNIVTCPTYPYKFMRDNVVASSVLLQVVIVTSPPPYLQCKAKQFVFATGFTRRLAGQRTEVSFLRTSVLDATCSDEG